MATEKSTKKPKPAADAANPGVRASAEARHRQAEMRHDPAVLRHLFESGDYPYKSPMERASYEKQKRDLQIELLKLQRWVKDTGQRIVIVFEGRDAASKGGAIRRFMENMNPRGARVVALDKPNDREQGQWYFQRYIEHLPTRGEIVLFDRSWYNRAGVERVMGFCDEQEYREFLREAPELERMWVRSGIRLFKYWFSVNREEQAKRLHGREINPLKRWKLSPMDRESARRWDAYTEAKETMFFHTHTADAPWTIIKASDKKRARIAVIRHFVHSLDYPGKNTRAAKTPDPLIVGSW